MERGIYTAHFFLARIISTFLESIVNASNFPPVALTPNGPGFLGRANAKENQGQGDKFNPGTVSDGPK
jgi:hypothetical protein